MDAIIFTGDLATTGMAEDLNVARNFISASPMGQGFVSATRFPTLNASQLPIFLMPGNHDRYVDDNGTPNCRRFDHEFAEYMPNVDDDIGYWIAEKENCQIAFLLADFCLQAATDASDRHVTVLGQGRVYDDVLQSLVDKTDQLKTERNLAGLIWVIHFAPFDCGQHLLLHNYDALLDAANKLGIVAILPLSFS